MSAYLHACAVRELLVPSGDNGELSIKLLHG